MNTTSHDGPCIYCERGPYCLICPPPGAAEMTAKHMVTAKHMAVCEYCGHGFLFDSRTELGKSVDQHLQDEAGSGFRHIVYIGKAGMAAYMPPPVQIEWIKLTEPPPG